LSDRAFDALVAHLAESGELLLDGPRLKRAGFSVQLSPAHRAQQAAFEARARSAGLEGPRLLDFQAISRELCHLLIEEGRLIRVADRLLHVDVHNALIQRIREHFARQPELSAQEFKELTGLSRSHAIPMLEHLDDLKITRRQGDLRVAGSENPPPSARS
jgi:selenocysteine-specific elongation factor